MVLLRTRTLRHEFLQALLRNQALAPEHVVFGGRLPERFLEAGVVDDDVAHFQKIVLAAPEPRRLLWSYEAKLAGLLARHEGYVRQHADGTRAASEVAALKRAAKSALEILWSFHQACSKAEVAALRRVAVLLATTDVALKIFGRAATPGSPAARLLKQRKSATLILDEVQRCPLETFCALGSRHDTVVAVGDRGQEIYPLAPRPTGRVAGALPTQTFAAQRPPTFAAEALLARALAVPGTPCCPIVHRLIETKRFGDPLATYLANAYPNICRALTAAPTLGRATPVAHVWYQARCPHWYNLGSFLGLDSGRKRRRISASVSYTHLTLPTKRIV